MRKVGDAVGISLNRYTTYIYLHCKRIFQVQRPTPLRNKYISTVGFVISRGHQQTMSRMYLQDVGGGSERSKLSRVPPRHGQTGATFSNVSLKRNEKVRTMKSPLAIVALILAFLFLIPSSVPVTTMSIPDQDPQISRTTPLYQSPPAVASAQGQGVQNTAVEYFSREVSGLTLPILNTYSAPAKHNGTTDLTPYLLPGWTLYRVDMNIANLTAAAEREVVGVDKDTYEFKIYEHDSVNGYYYNSLTQGFYNQPHNGSLLNYSFYYDSPLYTPAQHGWAYYVVLSNYQTPSSNITQYANLPTRAAIGAGWENVSALSVVLDENTQYYVTINGSSLIKNGGFYPVIRWYSDIPSGAFETRRFNTESSTWSAYSTEALLNYTYIPWNKTANAPLLFQPSEVVLRANGTPVLSGAVSWTNTSGLTSIAFDSNQSVTVYHNLTLWYRRDVPAQPSWNVDASGSDVAWNLSSTVTYPIISQQRYLNLSIESDWTTTGLYNVTSITNHSSYETFGTVVRSSSMTNGTWTLTCTAPNYVTGILSLDSVSITDDLVITNTIEDSLSVNATTGSTNLTIWYDTTRVTNPANETVINGATTYTWDIDLNTTTNGTYRIEVYWANGTEAGYLTKEFVVYYPTTLKAYDSSIAAYTNSTFDISVYFNDTYTPKPIDGSYAGVTVVYSFDGGPWTDMSDQSNGNWTATISTAGFSAGSYQVRVNGSGFAIENQSITIDVVLTYDTQPLTVGWSAPYLDNISYLQSTNLTVQYSFVNGTPIAGALVTVTDYSTTWTMHYDSGSSVYWLQFNGTDAPGLGTHLLNISASKSGYEAQFDASQALTVYNEPTSITVTWSPANVTIPYTDSLNLQVDYTYGGGDVPAGSAIVNVTIKGMTYPLSYTGAVWNVTIPGSDLGIGVYSAYISAWRYGYTEQSNTTSGVNITLAPNSFVVIWENPSDLNATYAELVNITVIYTYESSPVPGATVRLYLNTTTVHDFTFSSVDDRWHLQLNASDIGLGTWNATVLANSTGYDTGQEEKTLYIVVDHCTATPNWSTTTVYYTHSANLDITLLDSLNNPVTAALVNATYRGSSYNLTDIGGGVYRLIINGSDGFGTFTIQVWTYRYGFTNETLSVSVEIVETPTSGTLITTIGGYDDAVLYHDGWVQFRMTLRDVDSLLLTGAEVNLTTLTTVYSLTALGNGTYTLNLTGYDLGITTLAGNISADLAGYEAWMTAVSVTVQPVPTRIDFVTGQIPSEMYLNQTMDITFDLVNEHTGESIHPSATTFTWAGTSLSYSEPSPGRFAFTLSAVDFTLSTHNLYISLSLENYSTQIIDTDIVVRAIHTSLSAEVLYRDYENETIHIEVVFSDDDRGLSVPYGSVNLTVEGIDYPLVYVEANETYVVEFHILLSPGSYDLTFTGAAEGYDTAQTTSTLIVDAKLQPDIVLEFVGNVVRGAPMVLRATLTQDGHPLAGYLVYFDITVTYASGATTTVTESKLTDNDGVAELSYIIPEEEPASSVSVVARFAGDRQHWPVQAPEASRTVVVDPLREIMDTVTSPPGLLLLALLFVGIVAGAKWRSSHKAQKMERDYTLTSQYEYFTALASLRHLMIIYKNRGTCIFYHPFSEEQIQADLISGFISALMSMYGEIKRNGELGSLEEINYKGLIVNSREGKYIMAILIGEKSLPQKMRDDLQAFVHEFEKHYGADLKGWTGLMDNFDQEWIVSTLYGILQYDKVLPHTISPDARGDNKTEERVLKFIRSTLDDNGEFSISNILSPVSKMLRKSEAEVLDILVHMEQRGLIVPIPIKRVLQSAEIVISGTFSGTIKEEHEEAETPEETPKPKTEPESKPTEIEASKPAESEHASVEEFIEEVERLLREEKEKETKKKKKKTDAEEP